VATSPVLAAASFREGTVDQRLQDAGHQGEAGADDGGLQFEVGPPGVVGPVTWVGGSALENGSAEGTRVQDTDE
jgi:hypothetical protein